MKDALTLLVGIMDRETEVFGRLNGDFYGEGFGPISGQFSARATAKAIVLFGDSSREICRSPYLKLTADRDSNFTLLHVAIGKGFHWEKTEDQTFQGNLILQLRDDGTITVMNQIFTEDYLKSVISSEMDPASPMEFLKAHAILSRSWLLAGLRQKEKKKGPIQTKGKITGGEVLRWYDREDHDLFDICADDHCQRYQGMTKIVFDRTQEAVQETQGRVITFQGKICDARFSKACGGFTEEYDTAWDDRRVPYLRSISDTPVPHLAIQTEEEAQHWILSEPEAFCNIKDEDFLKKILPSLDRQTNNFFRWTIEYSREELEKTLREKSGFDFGTLKEILPLRRGPSGRISFLKIVGSRRDLIVGKELEIRKWLSPTHLYSSAFVVEVKGNRFAFHGAGWGHGVGLCQIGAAAMAIKGFSAEQILKHYFRGAEIKKIY